MLIAKVATQSVFFLAHRLLRPPTIRFIGSSGHRLSI